MTSAENNSDDWREVRSRADSIASAIFLLSGGALWLSITVLLGNKSSGLVSAQVAQLATWAWYLLLASMLLFLLLKAYLIFQAFLLQFRPAFNDKHLGLLNGIGWALGALGFIPFAVGMVLMVRAAVVAIGT